jgi:hypothetical protein
MEYPLGANRASGACKPTCEWDPKAGAEAPPGQCGFSKAPTTAQVEVFCCAPPVPQPSRHPPATLRGGKFRTLLVLFSLFFLGRRHYKLASEKSHWSPSHDSADGCDGAGGAVDPARGMGRRGGTIFFRVCLCRWALRDNGFRAARQGRKDAPVFPVDLGQEVDTLAFVIAAPRPHLLCMGGVFETASQGGRRPVDRPASGTKSSFRGGFSRPPSRAAGAQGTAMGHLPKPPGVVLAGNRVGSPSTSL